MHEQKFINLHQGSMFLWKDDKPIYIVGINYLPAYNTRIFWADFREDCIEQDMARIADIGLNAVRVPIHWPHFESKQGEYNQDFIDCFARFLDMLTRHNLYVMPFMLVGTCCGNYFPDYARGKGLFDPQMLEVEKNHLKAFVSAFKDSERILAWDLSDEPYHYKIPAKGTNEGDNFLPGTPDVFDYEMTANWARSLNEAVKEVDGNHVTTMGLHFGDPSWDWGFRAEDLVDCFDMFGPGGCAMAENSFELRDDMPRATFFSAYATQYHISFGGKPTLLSEGPMRSSATMSDRIIARNYSSSLPTVMGVGGNGAMPWVMYDYEEEEQYIAPGVCGSPCEALWGIFTAEGQIKPQGKVLSQFAKLVGSIDFCDFKPGKADVRLLLSLHYTSNLKPHKKSFRNHYGAYVLTQLSGFTCDMSRERQLLSEQAVCDVSIIPSWSAVHPKTTRILLDKVAEGKHVLSSYGGDLNFITPLMPKLFGVEVLYMRKNLSPSIVSAGSMEINVQAMPQMVVEPTCGQVIATFADGTPAAVRCEHGQGSAILLTFPLERLFIDQELSIAEIKSYVMFYRYLLSQCGATSCIQIDSNTISRHSLISDNSDRELLILTNHVPEDVQARVTVSHVPRRMKLLTGGKLNIGAEDSFELSFIPNGYHIIEILS